MISLGVWDTPNQITLDKEDVEILIQALETYIWGDAPHEECDKRARVMQMFLKDQIGEF